MFILYESTITLARMYISLDLPGENAITGNICSKILSKNKSVQYINLLYDFTYKVMYSYFKTTHSTFGIT